VVDHREEWGNIVSRKHDNVKLQGLLNYKTQRIVWEGSVSKVCFGLHSDTYVKMNFQMSKGDDWESIL
jgi:hypothetical protein